MKNKAGKREGMGYSHFVKRDTHGAHDRTLNAMKANQIKSNTGTVKAQTSAGAKQADAGKGKADAGKLAFAVKALAYKLNRFSAETKLEASRLCTLAASRKLQVADTGADNGAKASSFILAEAELGFFVLDCARIKDGAAYICGTSVAVKLGEGFKTLGTFTSEAALAGAITKHSATIKLRESGDCALMGKHYGLSVNTGGKSVSRREWRTNAHGQRGYGLTKAQLA